MESDNHSMPNNRLPNSELRKLASLVTDSNADYDNAIGELNDAHQGSDPDALIKQLDYHGITILANEKNSLPTKLKARIAQQKAMMVANDALKQVALATLFDAFNTSGVKAVLFKGSALAYSTYPKPWLRPRSDSDILICASQRKLFDEVFTQLGYQKLFAMQGDYVSYQSTYGKALAGSSFINIDLHWHINNRQMFSNTFSATEIINDGQQLTHFGSVALTAPVAIPSKLDSILIASVHRLGHHHDEERLIWLYDIHLLALSLNDQQWQQLCQRAISKKIAAISYDALETCHQVLSTKLNVEAMKQLEIAANADEPSSVFLNRALSERHYFWADIKSMPTLASQFKFLSESTFPSPEYVRQQMNTRWASLGYAKRFYRGLKRIF